MPKIVFWSPTEKTSGQTSNLVATACLMSLENKTTSLITHINYKNITMESSFYDLKDINAMVEGSNAGIGMTPISRLIDSRKISPESIRNYAKPLLKDRLDLLFGIIGKDEEVYNAVMNHVDLILDTATQIYDIVFIDSLKGLDPKAKNLLETADYIVINLGQSRIEIENFFNNISKYSFLKEGKYTVVIGNYDRDSYYNVNNLRRAYNYKNEIFVMPRNTNFLDALNEGKIIDFFLKNRNAEWITSNGYFVQEVRKFWQFLAKTVGIKIK